MSHNLDNLLVSCKYSLDQLMKSMKSNYYGVCYHVFVFDSFPNEDKEVSHNLGSHLLSCKFRLMSRQVSRNWFVEVSNVQNIEAS